VKLTDILLLIIAICLMIMIINVRPREIKVTVKHMDTADTDFERILEEYSK
jgi:hypothetical protein